MPTSLRLTPALLQQRGLANASVAMTLADFYPFIDASTGGNINGMVTAAEKALAMVDARTRIVPGHGPLGDRASLERYRTMLATIRDRVAALKSSGKSLADVQAAKPSAAYDAEWGKGFMQPDVFVGIVYSTL